MGASFVFFPANRRLGQRKFQTATERVYDGLLPPERSVYVELLIFEFPCIYKEFRLLGRIVLHQQSNETKMKKAIVLTAGLLLAFFFQNSANAQSNHFSDVKGVNLVNAGIGIGTYGLSGTGGVPLVASFEHGFTKNISAGIETSLVQKSYGAYWKYAYFLVGARGSYHLNEVLNVANPNLDVYGGAGLLYRHFSFKEKGGFGGDEPDYGYKASGSDMTIDLHAGARYLFNEHVGGFAELGYGISPLKLGVSLKF